MSEGGIEKEALQQAVVKIAGSSLFERAPQLRRVFIYLCERAMEEAAPQISEYDVAVNVMGRKSDFNPKDDNIVRVQVRHIRQRLEKYYSGEGQGEAVTITIPRGSYAPRFELRTIPSAERSAEERATGWRKPYTAAVAGLVLGIAVVAIWVAKNSAQRVNPDPVWSAIFVPGQKTSIVLADASRVAILRFTDRDLSLSDYLRRDYPKFVIEAAEPAMRPVLQELGGWQFTTITDALTANRLSEIGRSRGVAPAIRLSRHVNVRELKTDNFVLVGSRLSVPWVEPFEGWLNYLMRWDAMNDEALMAVKKRADGEPAEYRADASTGTTYATVALVPNLGASGAVLMLNGIDMAAAEAAGEFVASGGLGDLLRKKPGARWVEALLRVRTAAKAPARSELMRFQTIDAGSN